ncbi:Alpha/Beta hydrolase protein [Paraphysoderma sedebokerense]|nr:Alpha/Beta hydrolase protein [Paraphysoderma sedebokerense]
MLFSLGRLLLAIIIILPVHLKYTLSTPLGYAGKNSALNSKETKTQSELVSLSDDNAIIVRAKYFGNYATNCYCPKQVLQSFNCATCRPSLSSNEMVQVFENTTMNTLSYVRYDSNQNSIVVAYRGTVNQMNWEQNLRFNPMTYKFLSGDNSPDIPDQARVHQGFYELFDATKAELTTVVTNLWREKSAASNNSTLPLRLIVVGHSMGGALAGFSALHLQRTLNLSRSQIEVYTYNQPRNGNDDFVNFYDARIPTYRIVNGDDPVVHVPPRFVFFTHYGSEIFIDLDGQIYQCPEKEDGRCGQRFSNFNPLRHSLVLGMELARCR